MNKVKIMIIDKCYEPKDLYRYDIEFENGESMGSCFCYDTFEEAYDACEKMLILELGSIG